MIIGASIIYHFKAFTIDKCEQWIKYYLFLRNLVVAAAVMKNVEYSMAFAEMYDLVQQQQEKYSSLEIMPKL